MVDVRLRGRAGQAARRRRLAAHPVCARCKELGFITATQEIDHKLSLHQGGADVDSNVQGLCREHHAEKTAAEDASHQGAANHPAWLQPSRPNLVIVCGPPGAGKSTWVRDRAGPTDVVIDLDQIMERLTGRPGHQAGTADLDPAIRVRNQMIGALSRSDAPGAFLVVSAPYPAERQWWADKLAGSVVVVDPGPAVCRKRVEARGTPWQIPAIAAWYRKQRSPWETPEARAARPSVRLDGRPEGWGDE